MTRNCLSYLRWVALALAAASAGCASDWTQANDYADRANNTPPQDYRADIILLMRTYLNDPTNVRDAFVSEPAQKDFEGITRYSSCLRYNARKDGGQYAGSKDNLVLFRSGRLDRVIDNAREACKDAAYQPFPELQQLKR